VSDSRGGHRPRRGDQPHRPAARPTADPVRLCAHQVLSAVETDDAYANLVLPHALREADLHGRDAAFVTELVYGSLRFQGRYDAMIEACIEGRGVGRLQPAMRIALRMGAHQIHGMRVPSRAAVYETVNVVKVVAGPAPVAMANAVLRKVADRPLEEWREVLLAGPEGLSTWHSHPQWIIRAFRQALLLDGRGAELEDLLEANNTPAPITLVARPGLAERDDLLAEVEDAEPTPYSPYGLRIPGGAPGEIPGVASGRVGVQDEGSQLMALLAVDVPLEGPDERWLDMCAGPGGKAALLGAVARMRGAHVIANEVADHRAELVRRAVRPNRDVVEVVTGDGRYIGEDNPEYFDRVLLDAPCTGLGSLRRRPESRWRRTPADLTVLTRLQRDLIDSAVAALRPGGVLCYVTCSPHPAETVTQVLDAVRRHPLTVLDAHPVLRGYGLELDVAAAAPVPGAAQLWPHLHRTDAMFGAVLRRE